MKYMFSPLETIPELSTSQGHKLNKFQMDRSPPILILKYDQVTKRHLFFMKNSKIEIWSTFGQQ